VAEDWVETAADTVRSLWRRQGVGRAARNSEDPNAGAAVSSGAAAAGQDGMVAELYPA
jgi:hypothetical protein